MGITAINGRPVVFGPPRRFSASPELTLNLRFYLAVKGMIDVFGSLCGIVLCAPLWGLIALAIKWDSPGPVIFQQKRPGQWGVPYPAGEDLGRVPMKVETLASPVEQLTISIDDTPTGGTLGISWGTTKATTAFTVAK